MKTALRLATSRPVLAAIAVAALLVTIPSVRERLTNNRVSRALERGWLVATGRLVDVGGYRLRLDCRGTGPVTVVLDAGLCQSRDSWSRVAPELARTTRVCTYDRAGRGGSDQAPGPRAASHSADELHALLERARVPGPYVLVGHSFGGLNVRLYASRHPARVAGLVLVDASHEEQYERLAELMEPSDRAAYLGHEGGANCEGLDLLATARELRAAGPLPPMPLVVLTARPRWAIAGCPDQAVRAELQTRLARLSAGGRQVVAERSGHFIQLDRPEVVTAAIREVAGVVSAGKSTAGGESR